MIYYFLNAVRRHSPGPVAPLITNAQADPLNRRFPGGHLKGLTASYFESRNRLIGNVLLPELFKQSKPGLTESMYRTFLGNPAYAEFDERIVEYLWIVKEFANLIDDRSLRLLDVGCVLNNELAAPYIRPKFDTVWFMNPAQEHIVYSEHAVSVLSDIRSHRLPLGLNFDVVTCLSTIEHIGMDTARYGGPGGEINLDPENPQKNAIEALLAMQSLVSPGGSLYFSVPYGPFEYLYDYGGSRPVFYIFDQQRLEDLLGCLPSDAVSDLRIDVYKVVPALGWVRTELDDREIRKYGEGCVAAGAVALVRITFV